MCAEGYGRSLGNTCHSCDGAMAWLLIAACRVFFVLAVLLLFLTAVFLVGGLDGIKAVHQSVTIKQYKLGKAFSIWRPVREKKTPKKKYSQQSGTMSSTNGTIAPIRTVTSGTKRGGGKHSTDNGMGSALQCSERGNHEMRSPPPLRTPVGGSADIEESNVSGKNTVCDEALPTSRCTRWSSRADADGTIEKSDMNLEGAGSAGGMSKCCGLDKMVMGWASRFPLNKLKILVGVWQILAVFADITGVEFPCYYAVFLSWIHVLNFDLGYILTASCALPYFNFYQRLLATTLAPIAFAAGMVLTYRLAKRRSGVGRAAETARRAASSRHVTAGLLLTLIVSTHC